MKKLLFIKKIKRHLHYRLRQISKYEPFLIISEDELINELAVFANINITDLEKLFQRYSDLSKYNNYQNKFGESKTLCFEEAFIIYCLLYKQNPDTIVEIGTQHGKSTRRIIDMKDSLGLSSEIVCYDILDEVKYFKSNEARLIIKDITNSFQEEVLKKYKSGFIFLDARPYSLLYNIISSVVYNTKDWALSIHDCGRNLCNPYMFIDKNDSNAISSGSGVWERHVLGKIFNIDDVYSVKLNNAKLGIHKLKIFETRHGLGVITSF